MCMLRAGFVLLSYRVILVPFCKFLMLLLKLRLLSVIIKVPLMPSCRLCA